MSQLPPFYTHVMREHRAVFDAYERLGEAASQAGPLDEKTRALVKLALAVGIQSEGAVVSHTHRAREAGATVDEIHHVVLLGATTIGWPRMMAALSWVERALG